LEKKQKTREGTGGKRKKKAPANDPSRRRLHEKGEMDSLRTAFEDGFSGEPGHSSKGRSSCSANKDRADDLAPPGRVLEKRPNHTHFDPAEGDRGLKRGHTT